jgi:hypothetical protein
MASEEYPPYSPYPVLLLLKLFPIKDGKSPTVKPLYLPELIFVSEVGVPTIPRVSINGSCGVNPPPSSPPHPEPIYPDPRLDIGSYSLDPVIAS